VIRLASQASGVRIEPKTVLKSFGWARCSRGPRQRHHALSSFACGGGGGGGHRTDSDRGSFTAILAGGTIFVLLLLLQLINDSTLIISIEA
jgi:hypothetical protein